MACQWQRASHQLLPAITFQSPQLREDISINCFNRVQFSLSFSLFHFTHWFTAYSYFMDITHQTLATICITVMKGRTSRSMTNGYCWQFATHRLWLMNGQKWAQCSRFFKPHWFLIQMRINFKSPLRVHMHCGQPSYLLFLHAVWNFSHLLYLMHWCFTIPEFRPC